MIKQKSLCRFACVQEDADRGGLVQYEFHYRLYANITTICVDEMMTVLVSGGMVETVREDQKKTDSTDFARLARPRKLSALRLTTYLPLIP